MKIPKIEYEVYFPINGSHLSKLDLSVCKSDKISISIPVMISDNIDKYNAKSDYYNNICYITTSENGTDISLKDRKNDFIDNNMTLCEEDCIFVKYDYSKNKSICSCSIKIQLPIISKIEVDKKKLYDSFTDIKNIANIYILKCYKLLFNKKLIIKNYGLFITIPIIILYFISLIIFFLSDNKKLQKKIEQISYSKSNYNRLKIIYDKSKKKRQIKKKKEKIN